MKKLTIATDLGGAPIYKNDLREVFNVEIWAAIQALLSPFDSDTEGVIVSGCVISGSGPYNMTTGVVYLNGEFMRFPAVTGVTFSSLIHIVPKAPINDTRQFQDGTSHIVTIDKQTEFGTVPGSGQYISLHSATDLDDRRWSNLFVKGSRATIPWTNITLINSWTAASGQTPQYMVDGFGQVHFRGALNGTGLTDDVFAVIPAGIAHTVDRDVVTFRFNGSAFEVKGFEATATGNWRSFSTTLNNTFFLDGVSYWP